MAEIRSTMDIIMEKAGKLTLSDAEKKTLQKKEVEGKVKGFLVKFLDKLIDLDRLRNEMEYFQAKDAVAVKETAIRECMARMNPEADNQNLLDILKVVAGVDIKPISARISGFLDELEAKRLIRMGGLLNQIQERGVTGSAIIPNLKADSEWNGFLLHSKELFRQDLNVLMGNPQVEV